MKKILLFGAALVAAMSMNAQQVMTCNEAYTAAKALASGDTLTVNNTVVIVEVTAYVTNGGNGQINNGKQTFDIGETATETEKTIQAYLCNMPEGIAVAKGDKVKVTGKLMHYVNASGTKDLAEFVSATAEIIEKQIVEVDTISDLSVCEIIEEGESLNAGEYSADFFEITTTLDSLTYTNKGKMQQSFFLFCDNGKRLQVYSGAMQDSILGAEGDTVKVFGKIMHFVQGEKNLVEFEGPKVWVVGKYNAVYDTIEATVAEAITIGKALDNNAKTSAVYAVTGYVDSIAYAYKNGSMSFFMTESMDSLTYEFEAYSVDITEELAAKVQIGAKVKVTAFLQHYYKAAIVDEDPEKCKPEIDLVETVSGAAFELIEEAPEQGFENLVLTEKAQKVVVDGVVYIIRDNKLFNALGTQVK